MGQHMTDLPLQPDVALWAAARQDWRLISHYLISLCVFFVLSDPATPSAKAPDVPPLEDDEIFGEDLEVDPVEDEVTKYEMYDELGRTPPRRSKLKNRKWKDNKKHMGELEQ